MDQQDFASGQTCFPLGYAMPKPNHGATVAACVLIAGMVLMFAANLAGAQTANYRILGEAKEVGDLIEVATGEILVVTDVLRSQEVADALREAMVVRGVAVYVLTSAATVEERPSYVASLAYVGAHIRLSEVGGSFIVIDRRYTVTGPLIGSLGQGETGAPTLLIDDHAYAQEFVRGFRQSFERAQVYMPQIGDGQ